VAVCKAFCSSLAIRFAGSRIAGVPVLLGLYIVGPRRGVDEGVHLGRLVVGRARRPLRIVLVELQQGVGLVPVWPF